MKDVSPQIVLSLGIAQLLLVRAFAVGWQRLWTYGAVLVVEDHPAVCNILFWAGVPVLAALFAMFMLQDRDRLLSIGR